MQRQSHLADWGSLIAAVILFVAPWVLNYTSGMAILATCFTAAILIILSIVAIAEVDDSEEPEYFIIGGWLLISPWILGFWTDGVALLVHSVSGALILLHAAWEIWAVGLPEPKRNS